MSPKVEYSDTNISCISGFIIATKKYNKGHTHQASFDENILDFMAKAYTPLSLVDYREFRKLISLLDPCIVPVSRPRISRNVILFKYDAIGSNAMKGLNNCLYVVLSFDLWMSVKNEDIFQCLPIILRNYKNGTTTLA